MSENQENEGLYTLTAVTTMTFPNLMEAKAVQKNGKAVGDPKYSANLEFEPAHVDLAAIKALAIKLAKAKWPGRNFGLEVATVDANGNKKLPTFTVPWTSGDLLADKAKAKGKDREFSRGKVVLTSRSKYQPRMSAIVNGALVDLEGDSLKANSRMFYSGCQVLAQVNLVAYDGVEPNGSDGVTAYLNMVMSTNKGKKLTGGASAAETFKGYVGTTSAEDPTASELEDEEIPF